MTQKTILITGCSSGIGYACARGLRQRGWRVFTTARKDEDLQRLAAEGLEALYLEYRDPQSVEACAAKVAEMTGGKLDGALQQWRLWPAGRGRGFAPRGSRRAIRRRMFLAGTN